jgi:hypothetical protein
MKETNFIREIHKHLKKQFLNEYVDRNLFKDAIENKRIVQIFYKGDDTQKAGYRTIEPYLMGVTKGDDVGGNVAIRAWQQAGDSDSASGIISNRWSARKSNLWRDNMPGWRLFRLDGIKEAIPLSKRFAENDVFRPKYNPNDNGMIQIFYRVNKGDNSPYDEFGVESIDDPNVTITQGDRMSYADMTNQNVAWKKFYQEPETEKDKIKQRIMQFGNVIRKKRKESLKNYALIKDRELNDYKIVSQNAANNNFRGKYPPNDVIGNMEQLYREHVVGNQPIDRSFFTNANNQVKQASDKKEQEIQ